ncbi:hypothetical protein B1757_13185 [Acidithiobacillus marinus]|uniref:DNA 3'-5' helicase n=1 Tax=Acidithiobacillus marinus TaxID=187490 RepID=A0A2I1DIQ5_9PROT|nr:ATP-dependent helicase [Acidithiobacillus marinus]PKY09748.1 hypothetical protein B1757_13185 [Acidithiobacillus marinus]
MKSKTQSILARLSESQLPAALDEGHTVMVAGPGSGKTTTMVAKAAYLSEKYGPEKVAMLTFTRNAAQEMRERLGAAIGVHEAAAVHISTLHVAMGEIVSKVSKWKKRKRLRPGEALSMIHKSLDEAHGARLDNNQRARCFTAFNLIRSRYPLPDKPPDGNSETVIAYAAVVSYLESLKELNLTDYDSMLKDSVEALQMGLAKPMDRRFLIVDEYQDTDETQHEWIKIHARHGVMVTIVGDDDQSIYAFRGSIGYKSMVDFMESFPHNRYNVTTTYRTAPLIMKAATNMIGRNAQRLDKDVKSGVSSNPGVIEFRVYKRNGLLQEARMSQDLSGFYTIDSGDMVTDEESCGDPDNDTDPQDDAESAAADVGGAAYQEASAAVDYVAGLMQFEGGVGAILARTNFSLGMLEARARQIGIPYQRSGAGVFLDKPHISEALALISMGFELPNKKNVGMALSLYQITPASISQVIKVMGACGACADPFDFLFDSELYAGLDTVDDATKLRAFREAIADWRDLVLTRGKCLTRDMIQEIQNGLSALLSDVCLYQSDKGKKLNELNFFFSFVGHKVDGSIQERVRSAARILGGEPSTTNSDSRQLYIGTLHSAKGMEFDYVWLLRCNATDPQDGMDLVSSIEEERRLFYVGMTRAKTHLFFSAIQTSRSKSIVRYIGECLR